MSCEDYYVSRKEHTFFGETDGPIQKTDGSAQILNASFPYEKPTNPLDIQVAGDHYKKWKIQPIEFIHANNIPAIEANIIKYTCRWRDKGGIKDLNKIKHYVDLLIKLEGLKG